MVGHAEPSRLRILLGELGLARAVVEPVQAGRSGSDRPFLDVERGILSTIVHPSYRLGRDLDIRRDDCTPRSQSVGLLGLRVSGIYTKHGTEGK